MKSLNYFQWLIYWLLFLAIDNNSLFAQCGAPPVSGSTTISTTTIVNSYYPGAANANAGTTSITVGTIDSRGSSTAIGANDMIVIMQMQGADITSTNSSAYGANGTTGSGYTSSGTLYAGYYEYATVSSVSGTTLMLTVGLSNTYKTRNYSTTNGIRTFQVIRVPRYYTLTVTSTGVITAPAWNGATGGVVILDAANLLSLAGSINVLGLGFRGGGGKNLTGATSGDGNSSTNTSGTGGTDLLNTDYRFNSPITNSFNVTGGAKGEGIAGTPAYTYSYGATVTATGSVEGYVDGSMGRGAPGNAGGGGTDGQPLNQNQSNTGGGGGSNAGAGGQGGSGWPAGNGTNDVNQYPYGGYGGAAFTQGSLQRIIMGGGGGSGTGNNSSSTNEANLSGGPGGGIIIARALLYSGSGSVVADGAPGPGVTQTYSPAQTDAAGGGGGGGSIILATYYSGTTGLGSITASAQGGVGGYMTTYYNHGPGGGGGGGYIYTNGTLASTNVSGGAQGYTRTGSTTGPVTNTYNTTPGAVGKVVTLSVAPLFYCGVLPINLESFTASINGSSVNLNWQIGNAVNLGYFEIEYSTDGVNFNKIGDQDYINNVSSYNFVHGSPEAGRNYYRLKMVDMDGKFTYSNILVVNLDNNSENKLVIYPNPTSSYITLQFASNNKQQTEVLIFDNTGRKLISKNISVEKGNNYVSITDTKSLADGIYLIELNINSKLFVDKFIVKTH